MALWGLGQGHRLELVAMPEDSNSFSFLLNLWRPGKIKWDSGGRGRCLPGDEIGGSSRVRAGGDSRMTAFCHTCFLYSLLHRPPLVEQPCLGLGNPLPLTSLSQHQRYFSFQTRWGSCLSPHTHPGYCWCPRCWLSHTVPSLFVT